MLKPGDIAKRLGVEPSTVYRWIRSGELPAFDVAGAKYVLVGALERFLERRDKGVTIEEQAERDIGPGFQEEYEDAFDPLEGLDLPIPIATHADALAATPAIDDARARLKALLDGFEARYRVASERVHRLYLVEHQSRVEGVPDELVAQWAGAYAAYQSLSLVSTR